MLVTMERGGDLSEHRARALTAQLVAEADLVLVMGDRHLARVEQLGGAGRSFLLTDYASQSARGVSDPYGGDLATYRETYDELEREVRRALARLVPTGTLGDAT
jgi:protein-tyrosine-phosphatase